MLGLFRNDFKVLLALAIDIRASELLIGVGVFVGAAGLLVALAGVGFALAPLLLLLD